MQHILQVLFPYLVLLYLINCITYVGYRHILFSSHFGRHFKLKKSGLHLVSLLPTSETIISHNLPIFLASTGVYTLRDESRADNAQYKAQNLSFIAYKDIVKVEADGKVMKVNDKALVKFPSSANAKQMTEIIRELTCLEPCSRHEKIRAFLGETTNLQEIRAGRQNHWSLTYMKILSSILFVNMFGILPLVLYSGLSAYINLFVVVFVLVFLYLLILTMAYVVRRKVIRTTVGQRMFVTAILSPVTAMHILKDLTKEMYTRFDYLAIAAVLLPSDAFQRAMRQELLQITYAKEKGENAELREFWSLRESALLSLLAETGIGIQELLAASKRQDPSAASYCPLCMSEYRPEAEKCSDCGIYLRKFDN